MSESRPQNSQQEDSPVGDVRRVREQLSEQFGNDVRKLGEYARGVGEQAGRELGCPLLRTTHEPAASAAKT